MGACVLLVALAVFALVVLLPLQQEINATQQEVEALRNLSRDALRSSRSLDSDAQLVEFYRFFPKQDSLAGDMMKLYDAAAREQLSLDQGEYRWARDRDSGLSRYEIVLPVRGNYSSLRQYIAQVLADVPNLSLDGVVFSRQKIDDSAVDAQLRFSLYLSRL